MSVGAYSLLEEHVHAALYVPVLGAALVSMGCWRPWQQTPHVAEPIATSHEHRFGNSQEVENLRRLAIVSDSDMRAEYYTVAWLGLSCILVGLELRQRSQAIVLVERYVAQHSKRGEEQSDSEAAVRSRPLHWA